MFEFHCSSYFELVFIVNWLALFSNSTAKIIQLFLMCNNPAPIFAFLPHHDSFFLIAPPLSLLCIMHSLQVTWIIYYKQSNFRLWISHYALKIINCALKFYWVIIGWLLGDYWVVIGWLLCDNSYSTLPPSPLTSNPSPITSNP